MFITPEFWLFVLGLLLLYNLTSGLWQNLVLLVGSYAIYAYFDLPFLVILVAATTIFYLIGLGLGREHRYRGWLVVVGVLLAVGVLAFFKFFSNDPSTGIVLPLGISFYSFRLLSYLFDVYNRRIEPARSWHELAVYVAFFAQISAGPIERATAFLPHLKTTRRLDADAVGTALIFILIGLFYKFGIADNLAATTNSGFSNIANLSAPDAFSTMILYSIRLYADFAGYSAMAIGVSRLFMLPAMENFRQPYFSQNIVEFWTRWHISLSFWFRDYVYYPLSRWLARILGKRFLFPVQLFSVFVTMLLTGLWHGGNLTFLVWGALHGAYIVFARLVERVRPRQSEVKPVVKWVGVLIGILVTQAAVTAAWVFFGVKSIDDAILFFQRLFTPIGEVDHLWLTRLAWAVIALVVFDLLQFRFKPINNFWRFSWGWRLAFLVLLTIAVFILGDSSRAPFIYNGF